MDDRIRLGSQLFINKDDTPGMVRDWVRSMKEHGLELIRLFMIWDQLEPSEGDWIFDNYDACFDEAGKLEMGVVPTLMSVSPPGWMRLTDGPQSVANLDDPAYVKASAGYIRQIVGRYKDHPALDSWILWNEASRAISANPHSLPAYVGYLRQKYGDIAHVNRLSYHQYKSFEELLDGMDNQNTYSQPFKAFGEQIEWALFSVDNLLRQLCFIRDEIRSLDAAHPIHVNPHNLAADMQLHGQSIWREREAVDFLGCSAHPSWHSTRFPQHRLGQSIAYFADLMRSSTPDPQRAFWVTELQGGTNLYSGVRPLSPGKRTLALWMWESIGAGAKAVVFWCYNSRNAGYEGGEWSLLNQLGETSPRLEAVMEVSRHLKRHEALYRSARPAKARVLLLYSESSWLLGAVEGDKSTKNPSNPRNPNMYADALTGAYLLFSDLSYEVDMVNEALIDDERLSRSDLLVLPNTVVLEERVIDAIEAFVGQGGTVIADGLTGFKDAYGRLERKLHERTTQLFGCRVEDIVTVDYGCPMATAYGPAEGWFYRLPLQLAGAEAKGTFGDGTVAVTEHPLGQGKAIRVGTSFFQRYFAHPGTVNLAWWKSVLACRLQAEHVTLLNSGSSLRLRRLDCPGGHILILLNSAADPATAALRFSGPGSWTLLADDTQGIVEAGEVRGFEVPAGSACQLWFAASAAAGHPDGL